LAVIIQIAKFEINPIAYDKSEMINYLQIENKGLFETYFIQLRLKTPHKIIEIKKEADSS